MTIDEISYALAEAKQNVRDLEAALHAARIAACGIAIGDVVLGTGFKTKGKPYRVADISFVGRKPWVKGHPARDRGDWSKATMNLYDEWEKRA